MILQKITFGEGEKNTESLYYSSDLEVQYDEKAACVNLQKNQILNLQTYFNLFSSYKWKKYTRISRIFLQAEIEGDILLQLFLLNKAGGSVVEKVIIEKIYQSQNRESIATEEFELPEKGMLGLKITALSENAKVYGGAFCTPEDKPSREINIGIAICTFKREIFVKRNIDKLNKKIIDNQNALLYDHLEVCIADNAGTLEKETLENAKVHVLSNPNLGGVGGFTRGMLELMKNAQISHILLMDDDAVISTDSLERNYTFLCFLKPEYEEYILGGALLRLASPVIQYESGAQWNKGEICALKHDFRLDQLDNVLDNDKEDSVEYTGWWYSCIPIEFIRKKGLPLPLFIHRDDIEYGLRAEGKFIFLNGVCIWHEAFENKFPGFLEYYDVRNLAIVNAVHHPEYGSREFKKMLFIQVSSNVGKYRYRYVDLNLKAAVDFMKGFGWFYHLGTVDNHKKLEKYNYQPEKAEDFIGYKGISAEDLKFTEMTDEYTPGYFQKVWKMATLNGHVLPAKKDKIKVVRPYPNIYELYRFREVLFVDNTGKAIKVVRDIKELIGAYIKYFKVFRLIDKYYDKACKEYREYYDKLVTVDFWEEYLKIKKDKVKKNGN